jgi:hypothetical protein
MRRACLAIPLLFALAACSSDSGPDCGAVGNRAVELIRAEIAAEPDPDAQNAMESMLGPLKDGIVDRCRHGGWSEDGRRCFVEAETMEAADACAAGASPPSPEVE